MKVYYIKIESRNEIAIEHDNQLYYLSSFGYNFKDINELIESELDLFSLDYSGGQKVDKDYKILSPIITPSQDIICVGMNYIDHIKEVEKNNEESKYNNDAVYFSKRANKILATEEDIPLNDEITDKLDYEVELAVIISKDCRKVNSTEVNEYIYGFSIFNDISARDLQEKHKQWYCGKSFDGSSVMGPCILINDKYVDYSNLEIRTFINDEIRQNNNTRNMIFSVNDIISDLSEKMTLKKGTIIITGTPSGVGLGYKPPKFLKAGDKIVMSIEKIGEIINYIGY
ncbi:fumarylacetoacetate hydrolase family protein [uncultured Anaerococcus sp.]|uniref:fumarylacetoacetate hydrolase family protein n=1 Tax=uncultured Anaerococcus sp. TaxID=293428 RepID=UPI0028894D82|nr:fumarylacetoacetate hydrolase family protein [uncultured Anaerococcus sp.]